MRSCSILAKKKARFYVGFGVSQTPTPYTIVGGVPAKQIRKRFNEETIDTLLKLKWWDWSKERISKNIAAIQSGNLGYLL